MNGFRRIFVSVGKYISFTLFTFLLETFLVVVLIIGILGDIIHGDQK